MGLRGDHAILHDWLAWLEVLGRCALDPDLTVADRARRMAERQEALAKIQSLDGDVRRIASAWRSGWPGLDAEDAASAEAIFSRGRSALAEIIRRDSEMLETMGGIRRFILDRLKEGAMGRALVRRMRGGGLRPAVIVDDHL
jgi:hypothetical protein